MSRGTNVGAGGGGGSTAPVAPDILQEVLVTSLNVSLIPLPQLTATWVTRVPGLTPARQRVRDSSLDLGVSHVPGLATGTQSQPLLLPVLASSCPSNPAACCEQTGSGSPFSSARSSSHSGAGPGNSSPSSFPSLAAVLPALLSTPPPSLPSSPRRLEKLKMRQLQWGFP